MQDLKACRDYVLNLQDEKNLQMVQHLDDRLNLF
jgi:hypothetical protein